MKEAVRVICFTLLFLAVGAGQFVGLEFWPVVFSFSAGYHPDAAWVVGGLLTFSVIPMILLVIAWAAFASVTWKRRMKRAVGLLCCASLAVALWMLFATGGEAPLLWWMIVAPFVAIQSGAAFGLSITLPQDG